jgi:hypothetical protein
MRFSLRSLMLVVTMAAVFMGFWGVHWRTCLTREREHVEKANRLDERARDEALNSALNILQGVVIDQYERQARDHRALAAEYREAIWRPWNRLWIDESRQQDATP